MRLVALLVGTSMLAACGGGGGSVGSAGSIPAPPDTSAPQAHTFVNPTQVKTYRPIGSMHQFRYQTELEENFNPLTGAPTSAFTLGQFDQFYAGDATTARDSSISLTYNPRDAIFDVVVGANPSEVTSNTRYQDPAHRTNFGGAVEPQFGVPRLALPGIQYLQVASGATNSNFNFADGTYELGVSSQLPNATYDRATFFYQAPGTTTRYVTFAGFLRNVASATLAQEYVPLLDASGNPVRDANGLAIRILTQQTTRSRYNFSRGAFVFGEQTLNGSVLKTGTGSFAGSMLASSVLNDRRDNINAGAGEDGSTYFQWIEGRSTVNVNFGANTFNIALDGSVHAPILDFATSGNYTVRGGATFAARGSGRIDLVAAGGFLGQFQQAWFVNPDASRLDVNIVGSSVDGAFYGPAAEEVGGNFRIVGGTPDQRVDILGVFTGRR